MCSRYNLTSPPDVIRTFFGLDAIEPFPPRYNIAPMQPVVIVRTRIGGGSREAHLVRWGLLPSWQKDANRRQPLINARAETAADKASFRGGLRHRRCLVPANGFYEWTSQAGRRVPFLFRRANAEPLAFAAIADHWLGADGSELDTMAILTVPASSIVKCHHDRMPLLIAPRDFERWLDCRSGETASIREMITTPYEPDFEIMELDDRLNDPRAEGAELLQLRQPRLL